MSSAPTLAYVYDGQRCLGHMLSRGRSGVEAFDQSDKSLGLFPDQRAAADAICEAAQKCAVNGTFDEVGAAR
jgi:hypothetical protein